MPLHKHFQTIIHARADKNPPIIFPSLVSLISTILYKSPQKKGEVKKNKKKTLARFAEASYLFRLVINVQGRKKRSWWYKIIMHNYIHNSSL